MMGVLNRRWFVWTIVFSVWGPIQAAEARPAEVFSPYLEQIGQTLPPRYTMRLPTEILLGGPGLAPDEINRLIVKVIPSGSPPRLTISLSTCDSAPYPCLIGSFSVESASSLTAQQALDRHRQLGSPITLTPTGIQGYLQEASDIEPLAEFSSVMWQQDNMVYTIKFLAAERQNILYMAFLMANEPPIYSAQTAAF